MSSGSLPAERVGCNVTVGTHQHRRSRSVRILNLDVFAHTQQGRGSMLSVGRAYV
jgi:hypothetical protein